MGRAGLTVASAVGGTAIESARPGAVGSVENGGRARATAFAGGGRHLPRHAARLAGAGVRAVPRRGHRAAQGNRAGIPVPAAVAGRGAAGDRAARSRPGGADPPGGLVVAQVALSLVLVVVAWLFVGTFQRLASKPLGLDADRVLVVGATIGRGPACRGFRASPMRRFPRRGP